MRDRFGMRWVSVLTSLSRVRGGPFHTTERGLALDSPNKSLNSVDVVFLGGGAAFCAELVFFVCDAGWVAGVCAGVRWWLSERFGFARAVAGIRVSLLVLHALPLCGAAPT